MSISTPTGALRRLPAAERARIGLVLAIALLLRALPLALNWSTPGVFMDFDSWGYDLIGRNVANGHGFSLATAPPYEPSLYRTPGFPWFLAGFYALGLQVQHVILAQVVMSTLTVLMLFGLLRALLGESTAALACLLLAVDPLTISYTNFLLTEIYSAFVLTAAAVLASRYARGNGIRHLIAASALVGLAMVIHPLFVFLPIALLPLWLFLPAREGRVGRAARILCALFIMYIPTGAWVLRNVYVASYYGVASVSGVNMMKNKAAVVLAKVNGTSPAAAVASMQRECEAQIGPDGTPAERARCWNQIGSAILLRHPIVYAQIHVEGMARELLGPGTDFIIRIIYGGDEVLDSAGRLSDTRIKSAAGAPGRIHLRLLVLLSIAIHVVFLCAFVGGLVVLAIRRQWVLSFTLLLPVLYVLTITGGIEGFSRFRTIYMPFLLTFSAVGLYALTGLRALGATRKKSRAARAT